MAQKVGDTGRDRKPGEPLICPRCDSEARIVPHDTLYHQLEPVVARKVSPDNTYGVCRKRSCPVIYFSSDHRQSWEISETRTTVGFKQSEDESPHPICYCFGYTKENLADEIETNGESIAVEWITQRIEEDECSCKHKNPTGRCCLGDVQKAVDEILDSKSQ